MEGGRLASAALSRPCSDAAQATTPPYAPAKIAPASEEALASTANRATSNGFTAPARGRCSIRARVLWAVIASTTAKPARVNPASHVMSGMYPKNRPIPTQATAAVPSAQTINVLILVGRSPGRRPSGPPPPGGRSMPGWSSGMSLIGSPRLPSVARLLGGVAITVRLGLVRAGKRQVRPCDQARQVVHDGGRPQQIRHGAAPGQ